jgi:hypothetical protein
MIRIPAWVVLSVCSVLFCGAVLALLLSILMDLAWETFDQVRIATELLAVSFVTVYTAVHLVRKARR